MDFIGLLTELFSLGVTAEALRANIVSAFSLQQGQFDPKFQVEGVVPINHSSCQKTRMNALSCGTRMWAQACFVLPQFTRLSVGRTMDLCCVNTEVHGRTDRRTAGHFARG